MVRLVRATILILITASLDYGKKRVYGFIDTEAHVSRRHTPVIASNLSRGDASYEQAGAKIKIQEEQQKNFLGPPDYLSSLPVDKNAGASLYRYDNFGVKQEFQVVKLSTCPQIFLLRNYISTLERYTLQWNARNHPKEATVYDRHDDKKNPSGRSHSNVSWLPPRAANGIPLTLARCSSQLLLSPEMQGCKPGGGLGLCEPMQLVRYDSGGEFILHHDALGRAVTVLSYLNGVAGTWFPLANFDVEKYGRIPRNKPDTLQLIRDFDLQPGRDGLLLATGGNGEQDRDDDSIVRVRPGDAVVFYNYNGSKDGVADEHKGLCDIDWRAIHAALPATEEKFIATLWFQGGPLIQNP